MDYLSKQATSTHAHMAQIIEFDEATAKMTLFLDILAVRQNLKNVEEAMSHADEDDMDELNNEFDALTEMVDFLGWRFGHLVGYEFLADMRKRWGIQTSMHNVLQERYYKAQKARYEDCKRGKMFFTPEDRAFIEQNKLLNELHMKARDEASHYRELFSEIIEAAFPDAPFDLGWDEHWEETPAVVAVEPPMVAAPTHVTWASVVKNGKA